MNASLSLSAIVTPAKHFLAKHHAILFILLLAGLLMAAIFLLILLIQLPQSVDADMAAQARIDDNFDQATISRIEQLQDSAEAPKPLVFPSTRSNPFVE